MECNDCKSPHCAPSAGESDVYEIGGLVTSTDDGLLPPQKQVTDLALNCEDMKTAYYTSSASTEATFDEFYGEAKAAAIAELNVVYGAVHDLNASWQDNPGAQRLVTIRVCVKWKWFRFYFIIKL